MNSNHLDIFMEKVTDTLHRIDISMAKVQVDLSYHIRRSDILEKNYHDLDKLVHRIEKENIKFKAWITMSGWIVATGIALFSLWT